MQKVTRVNIHEWNARVQTHWTILMQSDFRVCQFVIILFSRRCGRTIIIIICVESFTLLIDSRRVVFSHLLFIFVVRRYTSLLFCAMRTRMYVLWAHMCICVLYTFIYVYILIFISYYAELHIYSCIEQCVFCQSFILLLLFFCARTRYEQSECTVVYQEKALQYCVFVAGTTSTKHMISHF